MPFYWQIILVILVLLKSSGLYSQHSYHKKNINVKRSSIVLVNNQSTKKTPLTQKQFDIPSPDGIKKKSNALNSLKKNIPAKKNLSVSNRTSSIQAPPQKLRSYDIYQQYVSQIDSFIPITGGAPLDNTMAISNDGIFMIAINSKIFAYDLSSDSSILEPSVNNFTLSLGQFAGNDSINTFYPFDPKLLYDPLHDRFILVFLSGFGPSDSKIVLGFSSTNNPSDAWYVYELDGNPRNTTQWTDYPALSISEDHLFVTANLIWADSSWQVGFNGSIIWQIPLSSSYEGNEDVTVTLWDSIQYHQKFIRNLCPVLGGMSPTSKDVYFLSNRNFDLSNDSLFIVKLSDTHDTAKANLHISSHVLDTPYGLPPNGWQADTDTSDPTGGLQTNDARWLGAFQVQNKIQFVGNTVDPLSHRAAIYHGYIEDISNPEPKGFILGDPSLDFAYPNIAFAGQDSCEIQSILVFDHSSPVEHPGMSAVFFSNESTHSSIYRIKEGLNYIDNPPLQNDPYERWGDYLGIQRKYNEPGKIWSAGTFGLSNKRSSVHVSELLSTDSLTLQLHTQEITSTLNLCQKKVLLEGAEGTPPYIFQINNLPASSIAFVNDCDTQQIHLLVSDALGCRSHQTIYPNKLESNTASLFPNPSSQNTYIRFFAHNTDNHYLYFVDSKGSLIQEQVVKPILGHNIISININHWSSGIYHVSLYNNNKTLVLDSRVVKYNK